MNLGHLVATLGVDTTGLIKSQAAFKTWETQAQASVTRVNMALASSGKAMKTVGRNMSMYMTLPMLLVGGAAFKMYKDFDASMSKIIGLVGVGSAQVNAWKDDILKLAPVVGIPAEKLADAMFFVTSAGLRGSNAMDVLTMSAKAAASGLEDASVVADLVTSAMNAYGPAVLNAQKATDILVATVREGKAMPKELAASMGVVLPIASQMGVKFDQVGAAIAAMTRTGTNAAIAATQLKNILNATLAPSKKAEEGMRSMGVSSEYFRKVIKERGLLPALMKVRELIDKFGDTAASKVFPNIRALSGVLDLMGKNADENIKIFKSLENATGSLRIAFAEASKTADLKWKQSIVSIRTSVLKFGESIAKVVIPMIQTLSRWIRNLSDWFEALSESQKKTIVVIGAVVGVLGPLLSILGVLVGSVLPMLITVGFKVIAMFKFLRLAMLSNPITAVIIGIGALAAVMTTLALSANKATVSQRILKDVNKAGEKAVIRERVALEKWLRVATNVHASRNQQLMALLKIRQISPKYLGDLTLETLKTKKASDAISLYISSLRAKAKAQAAENALVKLEEARLDELANAQSQQLTFWEKARKGGLAYAAGLNFLYSKASVLSNEAVWGTEKATEAEDKYQKHKKLLNDIIDEQIKKQAELNEGFTGKTGTTAIIPPAITEALDKYTLDIETARKLNIAFGGSFDLVSAKINILSETIQALIIAGMSPADSKIQKLRLNLDSLKLSLDNSAKAVPGFVTAFESMMDLDFQEFMGKFESVDIDAVIADVSNQLAQASINAGRFKDSFNEVNAQIEIYLNALRQVQAMKGPITPEQQAMIDAYIEKLKELGYTFDSLNNKQGILTEQLGQLSMSFGMLGSSIEGMAGSWLSWISGVLRSFPQILAGIQAMTKAKAAETVAESASAVASATASGAKLPFPANLIAIVAGVAAVLAALASIPKAKKAAKMAFGGTVPPGYPNDTYPALLTSGEKVTPPGKLEQIQPKETDVHITIEGVQRGEDLYWIVKEMERRYNNSFG